MKYKNNELTLRAIILGILLSVLLSSANTYLGLFAGMTVSASIPAAIMSISIMKFYKNSNILEHNLVQTSASAGESLAAGVIFTFPALVLMGYWTNFNYLEVSKIALIGGILGAIFTIPLRKTLIIEKKLKFPEGIATSKILKSIDNKKLGQTILHSTIIGAFIKYSQQALGIWNSSIEYIFRVRTSIIGFGCDLSPALIGVGYIIGLNIGILVLMGGIISWIIAIPIYTSINHIDGNVNDIAWNIWNTKIRFLGVGAMIIGGLWSIMKLIKPIINGIQDSISNNIKTSLDKDIPLKIILSILTILFLPLLSIYIDIFKNIPFSIIITFIILITAFLFSSIAAYMAGIVGSSNNPISGITIATILISALFINYIGFISQEGMIASILFGSIICCSAAISGDNMQDLKTGYLIGATPFKQQIMQIIGTMASALTITFVLNVLHSAYTIGSDNLPAPQANLMKVVVEGVFNKNLPWDWIIMGIIIGTIIIFIDIIQEKKKSKFRFPVLAVAVGIYLPIGLSIPIFLGSLVSYLNTNRNHEKGIVFASGLITGEAIMGILIAIPIFLTGIANWWKPILNINNNYIGILLFIITIILIYINSNQKDNK
tara:strand:- start:7246 stop:9057 length:1812 start_codon:yes stop_codon:yes gene_type:complete